MPNSDDTPAAAPESKSALELAARVTGLEMRLSWQDRTIGELDEVVRAFASRVEVLERELKALRDNLRGPETGPHDEKPPHY